MYECKNFSYLIKQIVHGINLGGQLPHLSQRLRHMTPHRNLLFIFDIQGEGNFTHEVFIYPPPPYTHTSESEERGMY